MRRYSHSRRYLLVLEWSCCRPSSGLLHHSICLCGGFLGLRKSPVRQQALVRTRLPGIDLKGNWACSGLASIVEYVASSVELNNIFRLYLRSCSQSGGCCCSDYIPGRRSIANPSRRHISQTDHQVYKLYGNWPPLDRETHCDQL